MRLQFLLPLLILCGASTSHALEIKTWSKQSGMHTLPSCSRAEVALDRYRVLLPAEKPVSLYNDESQEIGSVSEPTLIKLLTSGNGMLKVHILTTPRKGAVDAGAAGQTVWIPPRFLHSIENIRLQAQTEGIPASLIPLPSHEILHCSPYKDSHQLMLDPVAESLVLLTPEAEDMLRHYSIVAAEDPDRQAAEASVLDLLDHLSVSPDQEEIPVPPSNQQTAAALNAEGDRIICLQSGTLNIRDDSLDLVLIKAAPGERVNFFQSWQGVDRKDKEIGGESHTFVRVQFPDRSEASSRSGWAAEAYIAARSACPHVKDSNESTDSDAISDIEDANCCEFPTIKRPTHSFLESPRRFRANRSGGRKHAACDLYRVKDEPVVSIAEGRVIRGKYFFYQGTYAIEVQQGDGSIARYGEITENMPDGVVKGARLQRGQRLGYVGKVNSGCCNPMLHFELYSGELDGPLTQKGNEYNRRDDLLDPTPYLSRWMEETR